MKITEENVNYNNKNKTIKKLIFLVAFTVIILISSTYAWFSSQKDVTIGGLSGKVNVEEGLLISLDALNWQNEIDLSEAGIKEYFAETNANLGTNYDLENPYEGRTNILPTELKPVSTTAQAGEGIGISRLNMYASEETNGKSLSNIKLLEEVPTSGYYAIDLFLQNISAETTVDEDLLKLNSNSKIRLASTDKHSTGLQNTIRVAFALFDNDGTDNIKVNKLPTQTEILAGTKDQNIKDVAIWEPNASGGKETTGYAAHVPYIVNNNNNVIWSISDAEKYFNKKITAPQVIRFKESDEIPTYALTSKSTTSTYSTNVGGIPQTIKGISNVYDWANNLETTGLTKQQTLKTTTEEITGRQQLISASDGKARFSIAPGEYHKVRMYMWLEGQDVDCINNASLGGELEVDIGIVKSSGKLSASELFDPNWENPDGLHIGDFVNYNAGTWTQGEINTIKTGLKTDLKTANGDKTKLPDAGFQFGGFAAGGSRNGNAKPYTFSDGGIIYGDYLKDKETNQPITGWRIFDVEGDSVTLISAGTPEVYKHPYGTNYAYISEYILTGNINSAWSASEAEKYQKREWSKYANVKQQAEGAMPLTKARLDRWYNKYIKSENQDTYRRNIFQRIYQEPYIKYQNIIDNYSYYWLPNSYNTNYLYNVYPNDRIVYDTADDIIGVRILVTLSSKVEFSAKKRGTKTITGGNMTAYGGEQTYNVWGME